MEVTNDTNQLRYLDWAGLKGSEAWNAFVLPLLAQLEAELLESMEKAQPQEQNGLAGQLRMIGKLRSAPDAFIAIKQAALLKEQQLQSQREVNDARRNRWTKFGRAQRAFRSAR